MNTVITIARYTPQVTFPLKMEKGEARNIQFDWTPYLGANGTTVSSITMTVEYGNVSASAATESDGVVSATLTANDQGRAMVKHSITTAAGETLIRRIKVRVSDPELASDYSC